MDYEKKYKEALEKARQLCVYPTTKPFISDLQDLFPELKKSKVLDDFAREYSFNIPSDIYNCLPKEKQSVWVNEIENAIKAGAQWFEKQGEQKPQRLISAEAKEAMYDKPAWSEEDEIMIANIRDDLFCYQTSVRKEEDHQLVEDIEKERIWLKSIKRRIGG